ncbi:MAG: MlaD family protein [Akkermansiaceae bacterium]
MSKKASSMMIGLFTLIGLLILGSALVMLGAGKFFEESHEVMLYFDKSVNGLEVGSDVRFGGVKIGSVSSISVIIDTKDNRKILPVVVKIADKSLRNIGGGGAIDFSSEDGVRRGVQQGLRAGMKQQSLVTGQLYIEFDIKPNMKGFTYDGDVDEQYPVVPTIPTQIDELISGITDALQRINDLDLASLIDEMNGVLKGAKTQIEDLELDEINRNLVLITSDIRKFTKDERLNQSLAKLDEALTEIGEISEKVNQNIDPLIADVREVTESTRESLKRIDSTAEELSEVSDPRSPLLLNFQNLLHETETASRALRELTNDLKRNPNSLLRGKNTE